MISLCLALLLSGKPDPGPSPAALKGLTFYDVAIQKVSDAQLVSAPIRFVSFGKPGTLEAGEQMESARCTFTANPLWDQYELELKCEQAAAPRKVIWKWLGPGRAMTTLLGEAPTEVAVLDPTPEQRIDALGEKLAARTLARGKYVGADGGLVFQLAPDGKVVWGSGPTPGTFFACMSDCAEGAREQLCLRLRDTGGASAVFEKVDGGFAGFAAETPGLCNGPPVWQAIKKAPVLRRAK
jgi:hypothetical protein